MCIPAVVGVASMPMSRGRVVPASCTLARQAQGRMELSRCALRIFSHTALFRSVEDTE